MLVELQKADSKTSLADANMVEYDQSTMSGGGICKFVPLVFSDAYFTCPNFTVPPGQNLKSVTHQDLFRKWNYPISLFM
jgi:hypothetical protein